MHAVESPGEMADGLIRLVVGWGSKMVCERSLTIVLCFSCINACDSELPGGVCRQRCVLG